MATSCAAWRTPSSLRSTPPRKRSRGRSKTKNEFADDADERRARDDEIAERELFEKAASPRAVRVDGLRLKPRAGVDCVRGFRSVARG